VTRGLSAREREILAYLRHRRATEGSRIPGATIGLLDGLEDAGYVFSVSSGRARKWELTRSGQVYVDKMLG
jgi:hypothetical protein